MYKHDHTLFILDRIQRFENSGPNRWPTHRNIWAGSYDVWETEQDRIDAYTVPKASMDAAHATGLIRPEVRQHGRYVETVWCLTDEGRRYLAEGRYPSESATPAEPRQMELFP